MICEVMATMTGVLHPSPMFGPELRRWRDARRLSQEALAGAAGFSPRHVSCLERGVAWPSEPMVLRLSRALDLPLRERNALLGTAGYAARWSDAGDKVPEALLPAVDRLLGGAPWPAYALSGTYRVLRANAAGWALLNVLRPGAGEGLDLIRAFAGPGPHRTLIEDFPRVARSFLARARADAAQQGPTSPLWAAVDEAEKHLEGEPGGDDQPPTAEAVLPVTLTLGDQRTRWLTVLLGFGSPQDAMVEQLTIEQFMPADEATEASARRLFG